MPPFGRFLALHHSGIEVLYAAVSMGSNTRKLVIPAVLLGVLLVAVAVVYFADTAHSLPSFFPGHVSAGDAEASHHHTKHGIAAVVVAFACFAFAWLRRAPNRARP